MSKAARHRAGWQSKCYQMVVISNLCPAISLIFLYFFNSMLRSFPHIRWFTTALALNTGGEVSELVKVGDDSWGQTAYPRARRRRRRCDSGPSILLFFPSRGEWGWLADVCTCVCMHVCVRAGNQTKPQTVMRLSLVPCCPAKRVMAYLLHIERGTGDCDTPIMVLMSLGTGEQGAWVKCMIIEEYLILCLIKMFNSYVAMVTHCPSQLAYFCEQTLGSLESPWGSSYLYLLAPKLNNRYGYWWSSLSVPWVAYLWEFTDVDEPPEIMGGSRANSSTETTS